MYTKVETALAYPEHKLTNQKLRNTCANYFAQVLRYKKMTRYEYRGTPTGPIAQARLYPQWTIRIVSIGPPKRPFNAMFHRMAARDYPAEDAAAIQKMNRDFAVLQKALHEYARENDISVEP